MSGFQSPNYTQTPNDLFDELLPSMGMAELKVVLCIVRHTFGYHKDDVKMSLRRMARFTGLTAKSVMEGATQAEAHGMIERYVEGNNSTRWKAVVSVIPTTTPRNTTYHADVIPVTTQLGVKERKKEKENTGTAENIFKIYQDNIGMLTPMNSEILKVIEDEYPAGWFEDATLEAVKNNKRNLAYIEAILKRWKADGRGPKKNVQTERVQIIGTS